MSAMEKTQNTLRSRRPILFWSAGGFALAMGGVLGLLFAMAADLPDMDRLDDYRPNVVTRLLDREGLPLYELFLEKRFRVTYREIPDNLRNAILAAEDDEFFKHKGVRLKSIARAVISDLRKGSLAQGGSTITQQLAKVMFLTPEKKLSRKIKEALLAIELEKRFTKEEIFQFYCNQIYLGSNAYGVEAASRIYFGKSVGELTLAEAALLAGLPKAPEKYSPLKNPEAALPRRATVLGRMRAEGYINAQQEAEALAEPLSLATGPGNGPGARHFVEIVRADLERRFGGPSLYQEGLTVTTTLDLAMQSAAEKAVAEGLEAINEREKTAGVRDDGVEAQAALVALDVKTGQILAMVGSSNFNRFQFNHSTQAHRQPGSAFKPFVFLAALERGFTPASVMVDSPVAFPKPGGGFWKPENYTNKFYGPVTLRKALENSLNVSTVKLLHEIGEGAALSSAKRAGISSPLTPGLSLALGASEVTLLELTGAYATLANNGMYTPPTYIRSVDGGPETGTLEVLAPEARDGIKPEVAYTLTNMLKGVVENGTGQMAKIPGRHIAGKTGTTSENRDAWFIGYTPDIATGVWVGFDDNRPFSSHQTGGKAAAPIWAAFMKEALKGAPSRDFPPPPSVVARMIDRETGLLANEYCRDTIMEIFVAGTEPKEYCRQNGKIAAKEF